MKFSLAIIVVVALATLASTKTINYEIITPEVKPVLSEYMQPNPEPIAVDVVEPNYPRPQKGSQGSNVHEITIEVLKPKPEMEYFNGKIIASPKYPRH